MDGAPTTSGSGGGGGGPAPFLMKTYEMVDDSTTDEIVSWSSNKNSFVVWNPPEFGRLLLPTYFKHNNFSSFIRQLNTYGFRKIDPEKWEFANEDFMKDQKHLLKNIHRRKPIHSHSHPQGSMMDPERAAFEEEIERLAREKASLEANILRSKQQRSAAKLQFEDLKQRVDSMEQRQESLLTFLDKALQEPTFAEILTRKIESMDFSAYNKKRRLPQVDQSPPVMENSFVDNNSSSRPEFGNVFHQDFSSKLRLELSPSVSDINLVSHSTQCSNEDGDSPQRKISGEPKGMQMRTEGFVFPPETLDLSDTGASFTLKMDSTFSRKLPTNENPRLQHPLQPSLTSNEEGDGHISCHLNLTLASSPLQVNKSPYSARMPQVAEETGKSPNSKSNTNSKESDTTDFPKSINLAGDTTLSSSQRASNNNQVPAAAPVRVNDVFWEQFLSALAMSNPTGAAITHVLHNKQEFPFVRGVEDLLVLSIGTGQLVETNYDYDQIKNWRAKEWARPMARICGDGSADLVDQSVAMAFGQCRSTSYVRIQANGLSEGRCGLNVDTDPSPSNVKMLIGVAEEMLKQKNVESVLFGGKRLGEQSNFEKLDWFAGELVLEHERRSCRIAPTVAFKQATPKPT